MQLELKVKGTTETVRRLAAFDKKMETVVLPEALVDAASLLVLELRNHAPMDKGHLRRAIGLTKVPYKGNVHSIRVGIRFGYKWFGRSTGWRGRGKLHDPQFYGLLQQTGFYHWLLKRRIAPHRGWMTKAFYGGRERAVAMVKESVRQGLDKIK